MEDHAAIHEILGMKVEELDARYCKDLKEYLRDIRELNNKVRIAKKYANLSKKERFWKFLVLQHLLDTLIRALGLSADSVIEEWVSKLESSMK